MTSEDIFIQTDRFATELFQLINIPTLDTPRFNLSYDACSLAIEHWEASFKLLADNYLPAGVAVQRIQYECIVRSVWVLYCATDRNIEQLSAALTHENAKAAKNVPQAADMLTAIKYKGPVNAYDALARFKKEAWSALNSYVHSGIHALSRHRQGYPVNLIHNVLRNTNGLLVFSAMHYVVLGGNQPYQRQVLDLAATYPDCMPCPL